MTSLIDSPQIHLLKEHHDDELETDITDRIWALLGTAVHHILETGSDNNFTTEERLYASVNGWKISGAIDIQNLDHNEIIDYKVTSVDSYLSDKPSWEQQLNCYAYLVRVNKNIQIKSLKICAILRDWKKSKSVWDRGYPDRPVKMVDIPVWSDQNQADYVADRVSIHQAAEAEYDLFGEPPPCTDAERWISTKWATCNKGAGRATKLFPTREMAEKSLGPGQHIEKREGKAIRCENDYCGVARVCKQWRK